MRNQNRSLWLVGALMAWLVPAASAHAQTAQEIVDQFYPTARLSPDPPEMASSCHAVIGLTPEGGPALIIAGYSDANDVVARVLNRNASGQFEVSYESPSSIPMVGQSCDVTTHDFDGDQQLDAFFELSHGQSSAAWTFRRNATLLENVTPTYAESGKTLSMLFEAAVYDLNHDGTLQVMASGDSEADATGGVIRKTPHQVFRWNGTGFVHDRWVVAVAAPSADNDSLLNVVPLVPIVDSVAPYVLKVVNGERGGQRRVAGGSIRLNDVEIVSPEQLNGQVESLVVTITDLPVGSALVATLTGPSDAIVTLTIEDSTQR
jgi:hypothetical protein